MKGTIKSKTMIRLCTLLITCFAFIYLQGQNVGIGTSNPLDLLHVKDGQLRIEGNDKYLNFYSNSPGRSGLRYYSDTDLKSVIYYDPVGQKMNIAKNFGGNGLVFDPFSSRLFVGRDFTIGSESFGVRSIDNHRLRRYVFGNFGCVRQAFLWVCNR